MGTPRCFVPSRLLPLGLLLTIRLAAAGGDLFSAPGPPGEGEEKGKLDIRVVRKTDDGWTQPENLVISDNYFCRQK